MFDYLDDWPKIVVILCRVMVFIVIVEIGFKNIKDSLSKVGNIVSTGGISGRMNEKLIWKCFDVPDDGIQSKFVDVRTTFKRKIVYLKDLVIKIRTGGAKARWSIGIDGMNWYGFLGRVI